MMTFRQFYESRMNEGLVGKAAVAGYALQGKRHGDAAVSDYRRARQSLQQVTMKKSTDAKVDALALAFSELLNGLTAQRNQIGSVSAQVTAVSLL